MGGDTCVPFTWTSSWCTRKFPQAQRLCLHFQSDLIKGTSLSMDIDRHHFFTYKVNEALHISEDEKRLITDQFKKIQKELESSIDNHSK